MQHSEDTASRFVDLGGGRRGAEAEPQCARNYGRFAGPSRRSAGEGSLEPLAQAEPVEQATPAWSSAMNSACRSRPTKAMFEVCGRRRRVGADDDRLRASRRRIALLEVVAQRVACGRARRRVRRARVRARVQHADGQRDRFGAGPQAGLLEAAEELRRQFDAVPHDERADAERAVEFVGGDGHRGDAQRAKVDRQFADDLGGVGVERDAVLVADGGQFGDGCSTPVSLLAEHRGDEARFGPQQVAASRRRGSRRRGRRRVDRRASRCGPARRRAR